MELFAHFFGSNLGFLRVEVWQDPATPDFDQRVGSVPQRGSVGSIALTGCKKFLDMVKPPLLSSICRSVLEPCGAVYLKQLPETIKAHLV
jgi:hypothetical protein